MDARTQLKGDEGLSLHAYPDPLTKADPWTCGYGCTGPDIGPGTLWTQDHAEERFEVKFTEAERLCETHFAPWFAGLSECRKAVLINMMYQMGPSRLAGFKNALVAIRDARWQDAWGQMLDSAWARQTRKRANRLAEQMRDDVWVTA